MAIVTAPCVAWLARPSSWSLLADAKAGRSRLCFQCLLEEMLMRLLSTPIVETLEMS